ncbi:MAG: sialidase family protein [Thermoplasmatota archaeon]
MGDFLLMDGGPVGQERRSHIEIHRSVDGGATWSSAPLPPEIFAAHDPLGRIANAGDVVLSYAPDGILYLAGVATEGIGPGGTDPVLFNFHVFVTRSLDDGATWSPVLLFERGAGAPYGLLNDKEWLHVGADGTIHFTWTQFVGFSTFLKYTRSTDGGVTWSEPIDLAAAPEAHTAFQGTTIAAPGDCIVHIAYSHIYQLDMGPLSPPANEQYVRTSHDNGRSFGDPVQLGPTVFPRYGSIFADPQQTQAAFYVGSDGSDPSQVYITRTQDGGATWSTPDRFADQRSGMQLLPAGRVDAAGRSIVAFYDEGWPGGERLVAAVFENGVLIDEIVPDSGPINPGVHRREYLGIAGDGEETWVAYVAGDEATRTWIEVARLAPAA